MSKIDSVRSDMVVAMKAGEKEKKDTLSLLLSALKNKAIDKREDLTEEEENAVVLKEIKQIKETLELTPADRTELIEQCKFRIGILEDYAPKMMDEAQIKSIIEGVLKDLNIDTPTGKDKGTIMKSLMPKVKGKADGKLVNEILGSLMQ
ncbi:MAG: GatB/YqeY domain-containing protein [Velocimicrobium sp.]